MTPDSSDSPRPTRALPERPDLRHLEDQARDLLKAGGAASLAGAQLELARQYGFASWPKLKAHVESMAEIGRVEAAIDANDVERVAEMMTRNPALHEAPLGYNGNGPLTWAAECRTGPPVAERLALVRWMLEHGSDVHQGGDGPLMRAALADARIPVMEILVEHGADVNARWAGVYPIICAPCEALAGRALRWLIARGADPHAESEQYGTCVQMLVCTYSRNPAGKHDCLAALEEAGFRFPDTAPMALHRGRVDLLEGCLRREPGLLERRFRGAEIFPAELGIEPQGGLHGAPLGGGTLLHMAVEFHEVDIVEWLIDRGADVNARGAIDGDGFGGHTPLFHTTVTLPPKTGRLARVLLARGADPSLRATLRKQLQAMGDPELEQMVEFHDVTAVDFARQFQSSRFVNEEAIAAIGEQRAGGCR